MKAETVLQKVRYDLPAAGKIVVGLSGGADSVLLTRLLLEKYGIERLCPVHIHHGIRGEEADRDEAFVRRFCEVLGLTPTVRHFDVPALAAESGEGIEECARRIRYECFSEASGEDGCIVTAHNADDNAETLLMNLTRGMGPKGACGIPWRRGNIYRPLLAVSRQEVELLCGYFGLEFIVDSTNLDTVYTRNRLRHSVLPQLKTVNPRMTEAVTRFTESMTLQQEYMTLQAEALLDAAKTRWGWRLSVLREAHPALLHCALEIILQDAGRLSREHLLEAERCVMQGGGVSLPGVYLTAKQDTLTVTTAAAEPFCVPVLGELTPLPDGRTLFVSEKFTENGKNSGKVHNLLFKNEPGCDRITNVAVIRTRREGDRFRPAGRGVGKSLKKLFNELHIPAAVRDRLLVLEVNGEIAWIESVGAAEGWTAEDKKTAAGEIKILPAEKIN